MEKRDGDDKRPTAPQPSLFILFGKREDWSLPRREEGRHGSDHEWMGLPDELEQDLKLKLMCNPNLLHFERMRIQQLVYPKMWTNIVHTCVFKARSVEGEDGGAGNSIVTFRLEEPAASAEQEYGGSRSWALSAGAETPPEHQHPFESQRLFLRSQARFPGFDHTVEYDIFAYPRRVFGKRGGGGGGGGGDDEAEGEVQYIVVQALVNRVDKRSLALVYDPNSPNINERLAVTLWTDWKECTPKTTRERVLLDKLALLADKMGPGQLGALVRTRAVLRMLRAPLLFYLWPQKELMALRWKTFVALANTLEQGTRPLLAFAFSWLAPKGAQNLTPFDAERFQMASALLECPMPTDQDRQRLLLQHALCIEIFQRALAGSRNAGHTFVNRQELCECYIEHVTRHRLRFRFTHLLDAYGYEAAEPWKAFYDDCAQKNLSVRPVDRIDMLLDEFKLIQVATVYCVVRPWREPQSSSTTLSVRLDGDGKGRNPCKTAYYAGDDWIKQMQLVDFLQSVCKDRWRRDIHAAGCRTMEEVQQKIEHGKSDYAEADLTPPGAPRWDNREFQRVFAGLDQFQREAIYKAVLEPIGLICGRPGTGKTEVFKALVALFGHAERVPGGCLPLAAYGRIAKMLRDRLGGWAHTFHRAAATCMNPQRSGTPEAARIRENRTQLWDEGGLVTHHHTALARAAYSEFTCRIVIAGDPDQMEAIGSGSFFESLVERFSQEPGQPRYTHLDIAHRFLTAGAGPASEEARMGLKPLPHEDMAIDWNMRRILDGSLDQETGFLDLAYSSQLSDNTARLVAVPISSSEVEDAVHKTLLALFNVKDEEVRRKPAQAAVTMLTERLARMNIQFIAQRHKECARINRAVYSFIFDRWQASGEDRADYRAPRLDHNPPLRIGERITFAKNGYFMDSSADDASGRMVTDSELENAALVIAFARNGAAGGTRADPADYLPLAFLQAGSGAGRPDARKRKKRDRDAIHRGTDSDDVFNGDIRTLTRIVDVDQTSGDVIASHTHTKETKIPAAGAASRGGSMTKRNQVSRLLIFDDDTQINITDAYELDEITRAYCITSKKMQGSQASIVVNLLTSADQHESNDRTISRTVTREELYTTKTRAERLFRLLVPSAQRSLHSMFQSLMEVVKNPSPLRNNTLAMHDRVPAPQTTFAEERPGVVIDPFDIAVAADAVDEGAEIIVLNSDPPAEEDPMDLDS
jgi:hypothetical protein